MKSRNLNQKNRSAQKLASATQSCHRSSAGEGPSALRQSRWDLMEFLEKAPIGIQWLAPDGRILQANRAQYSLLGYKSIDYLGRPAAEFFSDPQTARKLLQRLRKNEVIHNFEARLKCKDGSIKHVLMDANASWEEGAFVHACCFTRDITERRAREKQILEISERVQQRIGQDLHDHLCQLLTGIRLRSILLQKKLQKKKLPEEQDAQALAEFLNQAIEQAHCVARGLHPVEFEAQGLMYALHELAAHLGSVFACRCECRIPRPVLIHDNTAAIHLYRIAQEAMANGIKHGQAKQVVVQLVEKKGLITLCVSDNGLGFPSKLPHNNGLGLPLMKYRARMIGGQLSIQRPKQGGTLLACTVPAMLSKSISPAHAS